MRADLAGSAGGGPRRVCSTRARDDVGEPLGEGQGVELARADEAGGARVGGGGELAADDARQVIEDDVVVVVADPLDDISLLYYARAQVLTEQADEVWEMADCVCRDARLRVAALFRALHDNSDRPHYRLAQRLLQKLPESVAWTGPIAASQGDAPMRREAGQYISSKTARPKAPAPAP